MGAAQSQQKQKVNEESLRWQIEKDTPAGMLASQSDLILQTPNTPIIEAIEKGKKGLTSGKIDYKTAVKSVGTAIQEVADQVQGNALESNFDPVLQHATYMAVMDIKEQVNYLKKIAEQHGVAHKGITVESRPRKINKLAKKTAAALYQVTNATVANLLAGFLYGFEKPFVLRVCTKVDFSMSGGFSGLICISAIGLWLQFNRDFLDIWLQWLKNDPDNPDFIQWNALLIASAKVIGEKIIPSMKGKSQAEFLLKHGKAPVVVGLSFIQSLPPDTDGVIHVAEVAKNWSAAQAEWIVNYAKEFGVNVTKEFMSKAYDKATGNVQTLLGDGLKSAYEKAKSKFELPVPALPEWVRKRINPGDDSTLTLPRLPGPDALEPSASLQIAAYILSKEEHQKDFLKFISRRGEGLTNADFEKIAKNLKIKNMLK